MLTGKLFAGLASAQFVAIILGRFSSAAPIPIYLQLTVGLCCVIFATTFLVAELWIRPPLNQKIGFVQVGFVGISVCTLAFEFELYPLLSNKPDVFGAYLIPTSTLSFLTACVLFVLNATWTAIRIFRSHGA
jgi:hypothetical protein